MLNEQLSNPTIESSLKDWREQGGLLRLEGSICKKCGNLYYPRRYVCSVCFSRELNIYRFSGRGEIINFEINDLYQVSVEGFREKTRRVMAIVKLEEGVDILGEIIESDEELIRRGTPVKAVIRKLSRSANTNWKYGYKFKVNSRKE